MRRKLVVAVIVAAVLLAGGWFVFLRGGPEPLARREVSAFLAAWQRFDPAAMGRVVDQPPPGLATVVRSMHDDLSVTKADFRAGLIRRVGDGQEAAYTAALDVGGLGQWRYSGRLTLVKRNSRWRVVWNPASLHPELAADQRFALARTWPVRAPILGPDGVALVSQADTVIVGLQPGRVQDRAQVQAVLQQQLGTDPAKVRAALDRPGQRPDIFVPIGQLPRDRFDQVRAVLEPVPGIFFRRAASGRAAPTEVFAHHVIGDVGDVTAQRLAELGPPYRSGDNVGMSGLEARYERQLAGVPSAEVQIVDRGGAVVRVVDRFPGMPPQPVQITLQTAVQEAADRALDGVDHPAALVAIDAATGEIRAVASRPLDQAFNRALVGRYPPGSAFKVVTTEALLRRGTTPETRVDCPATARVGGRAFHNIEGEELGPISFRTAFARSCNTAFVTLAASMSDAELLEAAKRFGFDTPYDIGLAGVGGQFPDPADATERAAAAIGQGRVLASPLHMATVAAAVASGTWRPPRLVTQIPAGAPTPLDPPVVATLRDLMREVVRSGTGTAAAVPGQDVAGKTGTPEFGTADPPQTHAWFVGFRGNLAFAVVVEAGGIGGKVAAPIAARFLSGVAP